MIINFNGTKIKTSPMVYTPGEDSFFLEDAIKEFFNKTDKEKNYNSIAEMGCGSGYLTINLMKIFPTSSFFAIDKNQYALELTLENINLNDLDKSNINLICSDLFLEVPLQHFDLIVFNPPYLPPESHSTSQKNDEIIKLSWEGGDRIIHDFLHSSLDHLNENGVIILLLSNYQVKDNKPEEYIGHISSFYQVEITFKKKILLETLYVVVLRKGSL